MKHPYGFLFRPGLALLTGVLLLGFSGTARAQSSGGPYEITKSVTAGGGGKSQSTNLALEGTVGQPAAGAVGGGTYTLAGGFHAPETQAGCQFALSPNAGVTPAAGGSVAFTVITDPGCTWEAASNLGWATIASGTTGNGTGTVTVTVQPNSGPPRGGTVTAAGLTFNLSQAGIVNDSVSVTVTAPSVRPATCNGYAADILLTATLTNTGAVPLSNLAFQVLELGPANGTPPPLPFRLISADGATCASGGLAGAFQSLPPGVTLAPGRSVEVTLIIAAQSMRRFRLLVSVTGR